MPAIPNGRKLQGLQRFRQNPAGGGQMHDRRVDRFPGGFRIEDVPVGIDSDGVEDGKHIDGISR